MPYPIAHPKVLERARQVIELNPIFLDTETTGIGLYDLVVEVGIVDLDGNVLYNNLINPGRPIPKDSSKVHGITDDMVSDAPSLITAWSEIEDILHDRAIGMYNAEFDYRLMKQSVEHAGLSWSIQRNLAFCVMNMFAAWYGEWNRRANNFRSQKLEFAGKFCGIDLPNNHHAIDDAKLTAALLKYLAEFEKK
ncbi:MAG: 3'-5' exonuclease [Chloroflexi bacterium]|nr:3'-5' exonuclease [Chloroflexota bacterium]